MAQNFWYPPGSSSASSIEANQGDPNTLANAWPVKITDGTDLALVNASGELLVAASSLPLPTGAATAANQTTEITHLSAIETAVESLDSKLTNPLPVSGPLTDTELRASAVPVSVASLPLPSGAATEATLSSLNGKVTAVNTGAVVVASSALPSGASTAAKQATSDINVSYDYREIAYVGATQKVDTITFKVGGSGGTTVAVQTYGYDGSDRVTSITTTY